MGILPSSNVEASWPPCKNPEWGMRAMNQFQKILKYWLYIFLINLGKDQWVY